MGTIVVCSRWDSIEWRVVRGKGGQVRDFFIDGDGLLICFGGAVLGFLGFFLSIKEFASDCEDGVASVLCDTYVSFCLFDNCVRLGTLSVPP